MPNELLAARYAKVCGEWSDIVDHLPTFVQACEDLNATTVIELGVRWAVSTVAWLKGLEGRGTLWSVDGGPIVAAPDGVILTDGLEDLDWHFLLGWDTDEDILGALPSVADIIFIDTQHTYELTTLELELYAPRVRPGGRVYLHDTNLEATGNAVTPQPPYPVRTAVEDFCNAHGLQRSYVDNSSGLGTIFVP